MLKILTRHPLGCLFYWLEATYTTGLERLSFGLLGAQRTSLCEFEALKRAAWDAERRIQQYSLGLLGVMLLYVELPLLLAWRSRRAIQHLVNVSLLLLALGLWAPMLTLTVRFQAPVVGWLTLDITSRGLLESILLFLIKTNVLLGLIILLFSVVFPLLELLLLQVDLQASTLSGKYRLRQGSSPRLRTAC